MESIIGDNRIYYRHYNNLQSALQDLPVVEVVDVLVVVDKYVEEHPVLLEDLPVVVENWLVHCYCQCDSDQAAWMDQHDWMDQHVVLSPYPLHQDEYEREKQESYLYCRSLLTWHQHLYDWKTVTVNLGSSKDIVEHLLTRSQILWLWGNLKNRDLCYR